MFEMCTARWGRCCCFYLLQLLLMDVVVVSAVMMWLELATASLFSWRLHAEYNLVHLPSAPLK